MEPRIYTYKITFEEIPDWYWGAHKEDKFDDGYLGSPTTHAWKWEFYTPVLEICELFPYTDEGWVEAQNVENRCIKPDLNNPLCLNEHYGSLMSLDVCRRGAATVHEEKDDLGKSIQGVKNAERLHEEKDEFGRSVHGVKSAKRLHKEKDELGRSVQGVKNAERLNKEKDELGRSVSSVKGATTTHKEKDDLGRSINAVKAATAMHKDKDDLGRSITAMKTNNQVWESTMDGFRSHSGAVAQHNKARGWDPSARTRIS